MRDLNSKIWKSLLINAKESDEGFEILINKLEPILLSMAFKNARHCVDDAMQEARLKIWQKLDNANLKNSGTIRAYLLKIGLNAIKKAAIQFSNNSLSLLMEYSKNVNKSSNHKTKDLPLTPRLQQYLQYIVENGVFAGAHQMMAKKYGLSVVRTRRRFHLEIKQFLELRRLANDN